MGLKYAHIVMLSIVSILSFGGLIYYQYVILESQKSVTERQRENNITALNVDLRRATNTLKKLDKQTSIDSIFQWSHKSHESISPSNPAYEFIYAFDSLYRLYGIRNGYQLSGLITTSAYCQVDGMDMGRGLPDGQSSFINEEQNTICLCHATSNYTFDIGYSVDNQQAQLLSYQRPTILSLILLTLLFVTCMLTLYALQKQKKISELRESFVNTLSHNFETPIFSINLAVKSLLKLGEFKSNKQSNKYLELIASENIRLKIIRKRSFMKP